MKGYNPSVFSPGDKIASVYTGIHYTVIESDNRGMAILLNDSTNSMEDWNAHNNSHFYKLEGQLRINF